MKGCVKNGKLRLIFTEKLPRHANAGEVARVMQRRKRDAAFDRGFHIGGHAHRFAKIGATMDNAMADHINLVRLAHNLGWLFPQHTQQTLGSFRRCRLFIHAAGFDIFSMAGDAYDQFTFGLIGRGGIELRLPNRIVWLIGEWARPVAQRANTSGCRSRH